MWNRSIINKQIVKTWNFRFTSGRWKICIPLIIRNPTESWDANCPYALLISKFTKKLTHFRRLPGFFSVMIKIWNSLKALNILWISVWEFQKNFWFKKIISNLKLSQKNKNRLSEMGVQMFRFKNGFPTSIFPRRPYI